MGEVYRALDTRLDRAVAIKVLAASLHDRDDMRERFEREARAIASLSHPNICTLHDVGRHGAHEFLVMEYLEGETLADRLARQQTGPSLVLPFEATLQIGAEIADALAAAHRGGIVHRDLKPGNVMLTEHGAKVLDFGLARLTATADAPSFPGSATTQPLTDEGIVLGTLPYMAPEQLEGRAVDGRADIFSLGAILYEMSTGRRAFKGDSQASLIAAILERQPDPVSAVRPLTPPGLERLVHKCLAKKPEARWQSASDVADELRWIASGSGSQPAARAETVRMRRWPVWALAVSLVAVAAFLAWFSFYPKNVPASPVATATPRHTQVTHTGEVLASAISPDGRSVAVAAGSTGDVRVLVQDVGAGNAIELARRTHVNKLVWTRDGAHVVFGGMEDSRGGTWIAPRLGGGARRIAGLATQLAVSPDGSALAIATTDEQGFRVFSFDGQFQRRVVVGGFQWLYGLEWLPRSNRLVLMTIHSDGTYTVLSVKPDGTDQQRLLVTKESLTTLCSAADPEAVFAFRTRNDAEELIRIPYPQAADPRVLITGLPVAATQGCAASDKGNRLVYLRGLAQANLWQVAASGTNPIPRAITEGTSQLFFPGISPDGTWIVATRGNESNAEIVRVPAAGGQPTRISRGNSAEYSPDGATIAFISDMGGAPRVWLADADGAAPREVPDAAVGNPVLRWTPDGRLAWPAPGAQNWKIRDLRTKAEEDFLTSSNGWVLDLRFSPTGDRVVFSWNRTDRSGQGLWLITWPGRELRRLADGLEPAGWSPDGEWIYAYMINRRDLFKVSSRSGRVERLAGFPSGSIDAGCAVRRDGAAVICSLVENRADAWIVEDFDTPPTRR
jgi:Tol biopolymer transport system component